MKKLIIFAILALATTAFASPLLLKDSNNNPVQGVAPDSAKISLLTVASTTIDMTDDLWWGLYTPTACKYRIMDTSAVAGHNQQTAPVNTLTSRYLKRGSGFINFSGCTNGELQRQ